MRVKFITLLITLLLITSARAEKYGLIIAVGDYPQKSGWSDISSGNDVPLIKQALLLQDFKEEHIQVITDTEATRAGILSALNELKSKVKPGDIVVVHYSGHGQQIFDDNGEEIDDKDEALVPYDALVRYTSNYKGENHIRDDEWGNIIAQFRNTLGKQGQLLILLDSCHSGSSTRGAKARGGEATFAPPDWTPSKQQHNSGSGLFERIPLKDDAAPFVLISGASADELNYEYKGTGSLSYAFNQAMSELGSDFTYRQLFSKIAATMNVISPRQNPTLEGDADFLVFNGEYVRQQPYYEVKQIPRTKVLRLAAGKLQNLFDETTVLVLPAGTREVTEDAVISKGVITMANYNDAIVQLETPLKSNNPKDFWVFVDTPSYGDMSLNVYLDQSLKRGKISSRLQEVFKEYGVINTVTDSLQADVFVELRGQKVNVATIGGVEPFVEISAFDQQLPYEVSEKIADFAQGYYLKNLSLKNYDYEFEFTLLPVEYDPANNKVGELLDPFDYIKDSGVFEVVPGMDHVMLQVTNKGSRPLYFSIVEINTLGQITPFMPSNKCTLNNDERKLLPGKSMTFSCVYSFGPPYETLILKGFATAAPINFKPTVETRGQAATRAGGNPLDKFIGNTYAQSRGSEGTAVTGKIDGFSTEFVYKIVAE
ncbi:caspase family protein [Robiginitalea sp. IMCC44478]|uniref:caspase family protein n=1 Tax=Robiginitalea sp. IMCC44478 TaxID=3459122 RepID=UPI0040437135